MSDDLRTESAERRIESANKWWLGAQGHGVVFVLPVPRRLSAADAILMAAWLVALAQHMPGAPDFAATLDAVQNS